MLSVHLMIDDKAQDIKALKAKVRWLLDLKGFEHVTLETERAHDACPQK